MHIMLKKVLKSNLLEIKKIVKLKYVKEINIKMINTPYKKSICKYNKSLNFINKNKPAI